MGLRKNWAIFAAMLTGAGVATIIQLLSQTGEVFGGHPCKLQKPAERDDTVNKAEHEQNEPNV